MKEIEAKLLELNELLKTIPQECKGMENSENRQKYIKIKFAIHELIEKYGN